jgi:DnaJ-class molecular chaperone
MKDPYQILGVKKSDTDAHIKSAFRNLAKDLHPDKNPDDEKIAERFKEVSAAYSVLGDKAKRAQFDRGEIDAGGAQQNPFAGGGGRGHGSPFGGAGQSADFEDILRQFSQGGGGRQTNSQFEFQDNSGGGGFADMFGFGRGAKQQPKQRKSPLKGSNSLYTLEVEFIEAAKGTSKRLKLKNGKTVDVKIPAGVKHGQQIRLSGQGEKGLPGTQKGDAMIEIKIIPHKYYYRDGDNIYLDVPITFDEALLGSSLSIPTIWGAVKMKIPEGTSSGTKLRLKGKGIQRGKAAGDQYISFNIVMPSNPDNELRKAIEKWRTRNSYKVRDKFKSE